MKMRDRIAELEAEVASLKENIDLQVQLRLDYYFSNPQELRTALLSRARHSPDAGSLMQTLQTLQTLDSV